MSPIKSDHDRIDRRSLALHRLVAKKLADDPGLIDKARANIHRWQAAGVNNPALQEWLSILDNRSTDDIIKLLGDPSERATRLRQSSPFTNILTEAERRQIYETYPARSYHPSR